MDELPDLPEHLQKVARRLAREKEETLNDEIEDIPDEELYWKHLSEGEIFEAPNSDGPAKYVRTKWGVKKIDQRHWRICQDYR